MKLERSLSARRALDKHSTSWLDEPSLSCERGITYMYNCVARTIRTVENAADLRSEADAAVDGRPVDVSLYCGAGVCCLP